MGATGSYTAKATISPLLFPFTKWGTKDITLFLQRGLQDLPETFGLRKHEFEYLVGGSDLLTFTQMRSLFQEIFDTDQNGMIDKYEVMCIIIMASKISSLEKVNFFFSLFNFNDKGYLNDSELTLLMMAVTRGAYKIDQKFVPPSVRVIHTFCKEAFKFAVRKRDELRKPELVNFVTKNVDVTAFLECWRGHAAQVLLPPGVKWRDLSFPCNEVSITPSPAWLRYGLPTKDFIVWRRRDRVGTELNSLAFLFIHTETFLKTVDRKDVFCGEGVLGTGYIKQGALADRHLLNALAILSSRPKMIQTLFAGTGQEEVGRFCVRLYEAGSWRSVYVDDRIPCARNLYPAFSTSSSPLEAWVVLLEKAVAKYMGSYGAIAASATRSDATLSMLRYLTGGHVFSVCVYDYLWNSVAEEIEDQELNGLLKVQKFTQQGVVAFGRSAALGYMNNQAVYGQAKQSNVSSTNANPSLQALPPLGHLFSVVGRTVFKGFTYLILRDAWGYIQDSELEVNRDTGYCNTFKVKVEDIPKLYDTIVVSQFPDLIREETEAHRMESWNTSVLSQITKSMQEPAVFHITVKKGAKSALDRAGDEDKKNLRRTRRKSSVAEIDQMLHRSDSLVLGMGEPGHEGEGEIPPGSLRLKDRPDFSRVNEKKNAFLQGGVSTEGGMKQLDAEKAKKSLARQETAKAMEDSLVSLSLTISSNCEWSVAGGASVGAELRGKLVPVSGTIEDMISLHQQKLFTEKLKQLKYQQMKLEQARLLEAEHDVQDGDEEKNSAGGNLRKAASNSNATSKRNSLLVKDLASASRSNRNSILLNSVKEKDDGSVSTTDQKKKSSIFVPVIDEEQLFKEMRYEAIKRVDKMLTVDLVFTAKRCWVSKALTLVSGNYVLYVDISFMGRRLNIYRHLSIDFDENRVDLNSPQSPAKATTSAESASQPRSTLSYEDVKLMCVPRDVTEAPWLEPALLQRVNLRKHTFHGVASEEARESRPKYSPAHQNSAAHPLTKQNTHTSSALSMDSWSSLQDLEQQIFPRQQKDNVFQNIPLEPLDHIIWLEVSSYDYVKLRPGSENEKKERVTQVFETKHEIITSTVGFNAGSNVGSKASKKTTDTTPAGGDSESKSLEDTGSVGGSVAGSKAMSILQVLESIREDPTFNADAKEDAKTDVIKEEKEEIKSVDPEEQEVATVSAESKVTTDVEQPPSESVSQSDTTPAPSIKPEVKPDLPKLLVQVEHSLHGLPMPPTTWPFLAETQAEAATTFLHEQLTVQRELAERLATDFIDIASKVNEVKKQEIIRTRQTTIAIKRQQG